MAPQHVFGDGVAVVTLLDEAEGFLTVREGLYTPSAGEVAAEEGREVLWRCGDEPTTITLPDGTAGVAWETTQAPTARARDRAVGRLMAQVGAWLAERGFQLGDDEPEDTDMGTLYAICPL